MECSWDFEHPSFAENPDRFRTQRRIFPGKPKQVSEFPSGQNMPRLPSDGDQDWIVHEIFLVIHWDANQARSGKQPWLPVQKNVYYT